MRTGKWLSWRHRFWKAPFAKCFPSTVNRKDGVFKFLQVRRAFSKSCFFDGLVWMLGLTVEIKRRFQNFLACFERGLKLHDLIYLNSRPLFLFCNNRMPIKFVLVNNKATSKTYVTSHSSSWVLNLHKSQKVAFTKKVKKKRETKAKINLTFKTLKNSKLQNYILNIKFPNKPLFHETWILANVGVPLT